MTSDQPGTKGHFARHARTVSHSYMVVRCKPLTKDHLPLKTAYSGPKGWSLVTGFTVVSSQHQFTIPVFLQTLKKNTQSAALGEIRPKVQSRCPASVPMTSLHLKHVHVHVHPAAFVPHPGRQWPCKSGAPNVHLRSPDFTERSCVCTSAYSIMAVNKINMHS